MTEAGIAPRIADYASSSRLPRPSLIIVLVMLAAGILLYCFNPAVTHLYPVCAFHAITGLHCPGCGGLRAAHQLLHGNVSAAFHLNPLFIAGLPLCAYHFGRSALRHLQGQPLSFAVKPRSIWLLAASLLVFSILRNLPFEIFAWMRP